MAVALTALKSEIQTDPTGIGYAPHVASGNDVALLIPISVIR